MFWAIFNAFISSSALVIWKKSLELNKLSQNLFMFLWTLWGFAVSIFFIIFWFTSFPWDFILAIIGMIFIAVVTIIMWFLWQKTYRDEKISVLTPFTNIDRILLIIISFFLFKNTSIISFWIALITVIILTLFAIDFSNFRLPKNFWLIILNNVLSTAKVLTIWWLFSKNISSLSFYSYNTILYALILLIPLVKARQFKELKNGSRDFYTYRFWAVIIWQITAIIWFFLLEKLGIIVSNLLGFLTLWATLLFSYLFLWDKPCKKDIASVVIISILVAIGYYFKDYWIN